MVWFQCEDCGENLKKPKLLNHFRCCSANKLSCIDCGEIFGQQSVQGHNQCITEAEKYGPKGQLKASNAKPAKANNDSKSKPDFDINVGLSSRPPWFCSLCNTSATSKQTLLLHAEGKKHRAKARAFHASQHPKETDGSVANPKDVAGDTQKAELVEKKDEAVLKEQEVENGIPSAKKKRKSDVADEVSTKKGGTDNSHDVTNGEVIQATRVKEEPEGRVKRTKVDASEKADINTEEPRNKEIKWKKLIMSVLKQNPDGTIKMKKLEKAVLKSLQEDGLTEDVDQLKEKLKHEINASSRFRLDNKLVSLVVKS